MDVVSGTGKGAHNGTAAVAREQLTVAVCSRMGTSQERVTLTDLEGLAVGSWDPLQ